MKCDHTDLLAGLLRGPTMAEGGRWGCEAEAFDGAVLGNEMENMDCGTKLANNEERGRSTS